MGRVDALIGERLASEVVLINEISRYLIGAGGKRLRPATVLLAARALGARGPLPCLLAVVIEFIHTATLLHDDVVDHSDRRRGRKTANAVWGNSGAVLSGDFLYSRSFQLMVEADSMPVMRVMADATNAISEGEVLQLMNCHDPEVDEARYLRVIELKTARLFQAAAEIGAIAAGADPAQQAQLNAYGHAMGMAYQLVDDLLDYAADPEITGKNLGIDLAEGKPTLPLIYAMRKGSPEQGELIRGAVVHGRVEKLDEVLATVEAAGAIPYTRALAERYCESAVAALGDIPDSPYKQALQNLAHFAIQRIS
ncbi:MAG: polyprenyl synthetase family protein [Nevskia sp.]|nr:polyprenyl synthetase family protein [Nevskia sp.]